MNVSDASSYTFDGESNAYAARWAGLLEGHFFTDEIVSIFSILYGVSLAVYMTRDSV